MALLRGLKRETEPLPLLLALLPFKRLFLSLNSLVCIWVLVGVLSSGIGGVEGVSAEVREGGGDVPPCTAGYGVLEATEELVDLSDNGGCNFLKGEVPFVNDTCEKLLEQGPCQEGEWLVIDDDEDVLECKERECPDGQVMFDDECHSVDDATVCEDTFELIIDETGNGKCDCRPGHLYHPNTERCYVPYTKGPCLRGQIIKMKMDDMRGIGECEWNPCPRERMAPLDHRCLPRKDTSFARCHTIGKQKPCKGGAFLLIEPSLYAPFCIDQKPNSIVPRIAKRAAPCRLSSHGRSCVRECRRPIVYYLRVGMRCPRDYVFIHYRRSPSCMWSKCPLKS